MIKIQSFLKKLDQRNLEIDNNILRLQSKKNNLKDKINLINKLKEDDPNYSFVFIYNCHLKNTLNIDNYCLINYSAKNNSNLKLSLKLDNDYLYAVKYYQVKIDNCKINVLVEKPYKLLEINHFNNKIYLNNKYIKVWEESLFKNKLKKSFQRIIFEKNFKFYNFEKAPLYIRMLLTFK